jgi:hypothetical protein
MGQSGADVILRGSLREHLRMTAGFAAVAAGVCCASFEARLREHLRMTVRYEGQEERAHPSRLATRAPHDDDVLELLAKPAQTCKPAQSWMAGTSPAMTMRRG